MTRVAVSRGMTAPPEVVFRAVTDVANLPRLDPDIVKIEFLSERRSGVGTRFRETRLMKGKEMVTELEITEWTEDRAVRMVADSHGTVWDTRFTIEPVGGKTQLTIAMDARPHKLMPKLLNPLMKGMFRKGITKHLETVAHWCESQPGT